MFLGLAVIFVGLVLLLERLDVIEGAYEPYVGSQEPAFFVDAPARGSIGSFLLCGNETTEHMECY